MHSSLPQQVANFGYSNMPGLKSLLGWVERLMIKRSRVVIVICEDLKLTVRDIDPAVPSVLIENAPGSGNAPTAGTGAAIRAALGLSPDTPVVLYTGTFEHYQGLDLLYAAMQHVIKARPEAKLVLVGGEPAQVDAARKQIAGLGLAGAVVLTGQRPAEEIPAYLDAATLLVSPRSTGTNTPLKIYQYLRSGRPIVATKLRTHTQVLAEDTAFLAEPTADGFAATILAALNDPARAAAIGAHARQLAETKYSDEAFIAKTSQAVDLLFGSAPAAVTRGVA
jgi:glycosyltransferase involved in cell wall biosynthesis